MKSEGALLHGSDRKRSRVTPELLVEKHFMDVYAVCFRHLGHPQDAEDATQETFAALFRDSHKLESIASPKAWLMTVARNTAVSMFREKRRHRTMDAEPETAPVLRDPVDRDRLGEALAALSEKDRELIEKRFLQEERAGEISMTTGSSAGAVRTGLCRALKRLRALYHGREPR